MAAAKKKAVKAATDLKKPAKAATDLVFWPEIVELPIAFFSLIRNANAGPFRFCIITI